MAEEINFKSELPALLTQLLGTKTTQQGGTTTQTGSTTSTANVDPLMKIFQQQSASSTPEGMQAALTELFTKGAENVPVLTSALANATGTRSSNNSPLALSLAELNKNLAGQAATLAMQQQTNASNTAANIANATKGTTSTASTTTPKLTTTTGNPTAAKAATVGGLLLNGADKLGLTKYLKSGAQSVGSQISEALGFNSDPLMGGEATGLLYGATDFEDVGPQLLGSSGLGAEFDTYLSPISDAATGISEVGSNFLDVGAEAGGGVLDGIGETLASAGDTISDFGSEIYDEVSSWFADGGLVDVRRIREYQSKQQKPVGQKQNYADGGIVRNKNNLGAPTRVERTSALSATPEQRARAAGMAAPKQAASGTATSATAPAQVTRPAAAAMNYSESPGGGTAQTAAGQIGTPAQNQAAMNAFGMSLGTAVASATLGPLGGLAMSLGGKLASQPSLPGFMIGQAKASYNALAPTTFDAITGQVTGEADPTANNVNNALDGFLGLNDNFGTTDGGGDAGMGDAGGVNGSAGNSAGDGAGSTSAGGDAVAADGGHIQGKGTGVSDSISAKLSDGEFVISADVVEALGADFFHNLQNKFHTPAAVQRMQRR